LASASPRPEHVCAGAHAPPRCPPMARRPRPYAGVARSPASTISRRRGPTSCRRRGRFAPPSRRMARRAWRCMADAVHCCGSQAPCFNERPRPAGRGTIQLLSGWLPVVVWPWHRPQLAGAVVWRWSCRRTLQRQAPRGGRVRFLYAT
jgi:hypothetical protein